MKLTENLKALSYCFFLSLSRTRSALDLSLGLLRITSNGSDCGFDESSAALLNDVLSGEDVL